MQPYTGQLQRTLARGQASWADHLTVLAAVQTDAPLTAVATLMDASSGLARYIAVGDLQGSMYLFQPTGELQLHSQAGVGSSAAACLTVMNVVWLGQQHTAACGKHCCLHEQISFVCI